MNIFDRRAFLVSSISAGVVATSPALAQTDSEDAKLLRRFDAIFDALVEESPERATTNGLDKGGRAALKSKLDNRSRAGKTRQLQLRRDALTQISVIDRAKLSAPAKINYDVVRYQLETAVMFGGRYTFGDTIGDVGGNFIPYVISQRSGAYSTVPDLLDSQHKIADAADADAYLSRLRGFAVAMDQELARQKSDVAAGVVPADFICDLTLGQMKTLRDQPAAQADLVTSLVRKAKSANLSADYGAMAEKIVNDDVFPALDRQIAAMQTLRAKAKPDTGVWALPDGEAYYADAVRASTTTDHTPQQLHDMGLEQVAEISSRLDDILKSQGMSQGGVGARLMALNTAPSQVFPETDAGRDQILAELNVQITAMSKLLPRAFTTPPKVKVEVRRIPVLIQDGAAIGYYWAAALDGSRPGAFYINLKETSDWPRYNLPTLAHHETVPGHHLQNVAAQQSADIPMLRRARALGGFSAFGEGWGLYAEQLSDEIGAYENDPLGRAGYLQSLLFRAVRLVTDTGIHAKRWTRAQATQYMVDTVGNTPARSQREVERYFASPGQATAYKVGHTMWVQVREDAKARLGSKFDLKAYHDAVLSFGAVPLTILQRHTADWVQTQI